MFSDDEIKSIDSLVIDYIRQASIWNLEEMNDFERTQVITNLRRSTNLLTQKQYYLSKLIVGGENLDLLAQQLMTFLDDESKTIKEKQFVVEFLSV